MFIVDDILLARIVLPYGERLFNHGRDELYNWLDQQLDRKGRRIFARLRRKKKDLTADEILRKLGDYAEQKRRQSQPPPSPPPPVKAPPPKAKAAARR